MKKLKIGKISAYVGIVVLAAITLFYYFKTDKTIKSQNKTINFLSSNAQYTDGLNEYYSELLKFEMQSANSSFKKALVKVYDITADTNKSRPIEINSIFDKNKYSLVLRYTQIGCDECSSLTIKKMKELRKAHPELPVYAFVDFTNYDSYLQWRKIGEVDFPVFYVKKGGFEFDKNCNDYSYLFLVNKDAVASSFFIPNSGIPDMLTYYFDNIYKNVL